MLLGFLPFLTFAVLSGHVGGAAALGAGALVAAALILCGRLQGERAKILEIGTLALFAALAIWSLFAPAPPSLRMTRLLVDVGLFAIVLGSLLAGRPFTLQYARERIPPQYWQDPRFLATNRVITLAWVAALFVSLLCDVALVWVPGIPVALDIALTVAAMVAAGIFTHRTADAARAAGRAGTTGS